MPNKLSNLFNKLTDNITELISEVKKKKLGLMATDEWTVKDVFAHIVYWHENYAANYKALAEDKEPPLLVGPIYRFNKEGVSSLRKYSLDELIKKLQRANNTLFTSIIEKKVPQMTYKKDGHVFKTPDFLVLVARHIATHTKHIKRAK